MSEFITLPANNLIYAVGWTILHSLWQISLLAVIFRMIMLAMKNNSSSSRYHVSVASLMIVLVLSIATFTNEYSNATNDFELTEHYQLAKTELDMNDELEDLSNTTFLSSLTNKFKLFVDKNIAFIVITWNVCVLILLLKLVVGLFYNLKMQKSRTSLLPEQMNKKFRHLAQIMGVNKSIEILESAVIKVPLVIGYFKPVILLPVGIMTGLTSDQIEAVIKHELAHIKRNDYLINIFQSLIEILFFYHPAIWYISKTIRNERESACDEMAMANNTSRISLAKALTNIEIINHKKIEYAMAFTRNKNTLLNRIKRIVNHQKKEFTLKEGLISTFIIVFGLIIMSFSAKFVLNSEEGHQIDQNSNYSVINPEKTLLSAKSTAIPFELIQRKKQSDYSKKLSDILKEDQVLTDDTIIKIKGEDQIEYTIKGTVYNLSYDKNKKVNSFSVNKKSIPKEDWNKYDKEIKLGFQLKEKAEQEMQMHEKEMVEFEKQMKIHEKEMQMHEKEMVEFEKQMKIHEKEMQNHEKQLAQYEEQMKKHDFDTEKNEKELAEFEKQMEQHEKEMIKHEKEITQFKKQMNEQIKFTKENHEQEIKKYEAEMKKHEAEMKLHEEKFSIIEDLIDEMKKDQLIDKNAKSYRITFTKNEFLINGKKQTTKLFEKYKKLFQSKSKGKFKLEGDYRINTD